MAVPPRHLTETAGRGISPTRISRSRALSLAKAALRKMKTATAQHAAGIAAQTKSAGIESFMPMSTPPTTGPRIDPMRPIPSAQPAPVERTNVG